MAMSKTQAATLFWRLAVLRRQLERTRLEIKELCAAVGPTDDDENLEDLVAQMHEAAGFLSEAVTYLTPYVGHVDQPLPIQSYS